MDAEINQLLRTCVINTIQLKIIRTKGFVAKKDVRIRLLLWGFVLITIRILDHQKTGYVRLMNVMKILGSKNTDIATNII
jgi:hypothetical protein